MSIGTRIMFTLLACAAISSPIAVDAQSLQEKTSTIKVFDNLKGRKLDLQTTYCPALPLTKKQIKEHKREIKLHELEKRKSQRSITLSNWLSKNRLSSIEPKYRKLFKNNPVVYVISFDGKSEFGSLRLLNKSSTEAEECSMEILQNFFPLPPPPSETHYMKGLILRINSTGVSLKIANSQT